LQPVFRRKHNEPSNPPSADQDERCFHLRASVLECGGERSGSTAFGGSRADRRPTKRCRRPPHEIDQREQPCLVPLGYLTGQALPPQSKTSQCRDAPAVPDVLRSAGVQPASDCGSPFRRFSCEATASWTLAIQCGLDSRAPKPRGVGRRIGQHLPSVGSMTLNTRFSRTAIVASATFLAFALVASIAVAVTSRFRSLETRLTDQEAQLNALKKTAHPELRVRTGRFHIRTPGNPQSTNWSNLTLDPLGTEVQIITNFVWKEPGQIKAIWVSDWSPREEIVKFDEFRVVGEGQYPSEFHVHAKPKNGASVSMNFTVSVLCE
jgi:hypothetical protein